MPLFAFPEGDPAYDNYKRPKLNSKMIKLRGMVTTLRKAASSEAPAAAGLCISSQVGGTRLPKGLL